jgi:hypothetical protein
MPPKLRYSCVSVLIWCVLCCFVLVCLITDGKKVNND